MNTTVGFALVLGLLSAGSLAHAAPPVSCAQRFQAAGIDPSRLSPGDRGRLDGHDFIVARDDIPAEKICARVDAEDQKTKSLQAQLAGIASQLSGAQAEINVLASGGPLKEHYLVIEGGLLAWAVIASIWAGYFAGRLDPRRR